MEKKEKINLQANLYSLLPISLRQPINNLRLLPSFIQWYFSNNGRQHVVNSLSSRKGIFEGFRCVVIGNGPSLKKMDLSSLVNEYTFGLNRIYLMFEELGFETDFLVVSNGLVMSQFSEEIMATKSTKFLNWKHREKFEIDNNTIMLSANPIKKPTGNILNGYFPGGGTVTNVAIEISFFLGFSEVILIGVDHNYSKKGKPGIAITSKEQDQDHFSPDYFGKGITWQLPNYVNMEIGYDENRKLFQNNGRVIVDGTLGGKLEIFPKVTFDKYLSESQFKNKT